MNFPTSATPKRRLKATSLLKLPPSTLTPSSSPLTSFQNPPKPSKIKVLNPKATTFALKMLKQNLHLCTGPDAKPASSISQIKNISQLLPHKRGLRNLNATPKRIRFDVKILGLSEDLQEGEEGLRGRMKGKKRRRPRSYKGVPEGYKLSMGVLVKDLEQRFPLRNGKGPSGFSQGDFYKDLEEKITDEIYRIENEDGYKNKFESRMRYLNKKKYKREVKAKKVRSKLLRHNKEMAKNWSQIKKEVQSPAHSGTPMNKRFYSSTQSFKIKRSLSKKPSRRYGKPPIPKKSVTKSFKDYTLFL